MSTTLKIDPSRILKKKRESKFSTALKNVWIFRENLVIEGLYWLKLIIFDKKHVKNENSKQQFQNVPNV